MESKGKVNDIGASWIPLPYFSLEEWSYAMLPHL